MRFANAYFINGNSYAGKSTMIRMLAEKYDGILCGENYHRKYFPVVDPEEFPVISHTRSHRDSDRFTRRSPKEHLAWMEGVRGECEVMELRILEELSKQDKPIFVDTNISLETLKEAADPRHVLIMLADPMVSVNRFFERPDREKQYLYQLIMKEPDPEAAMENYRECLMMVNSREQYEQFLHSGFQVILRDDNRTAEETLALVEQAFGLSTQ